MCVYRQSDWRDRPSFVTVLAQVLNDSEEGLRLWRA